MSDLIVLLWLGFILSSAVFFSSSSILYQFQQNSFSFDKGFLLSLSACLVALVLCLSMWPPVHRVYDDECLFISQSNNICLLGKASITQKGSRLQPEIVNSWTETPKFPGFALIEAGVFFLTKDIKNSFFILNIVLGTLSVAVVFRITWALSASYVVSWWSAVFFACLPARCTYAMSAACDIAGLFFFLLFLLFLTDFKTLKVRRVLYAAIFCGIYSVCIKPFYGIFVLLGLGMALYIYQKDGLLNRKNCKQIVLDSVCLFLPIFILVHFAYIKAGAWSFSFIFSNLYSSISYLFDYKQDTVLTVIACLFVIARNVIYEKDNVTNWIAGWFLMGFLVLSVFCAGGFTYPGQAYSDRYFLFLAFPFVFLAGKGMAGILKIFRFWIFGVIFFILLFVNALAACHNLNNKANDNYYYKKTLLFKQVFKFIPNDAYFLDECPTLVTAISARKSISTELFFKGNHPQKIVFLKGIPLDSYDSNDSKQMDSLNHILNAEYVCKPKSPALIKQGFLSVIPFLCIRK